MASGLTATVNSLGVDGQAPDAVCMSMRTVALEPPVRIQPVIAGTVPIGHLWPDAEDLGSGLSYLVALARRLRGPLWGATITGVIWAGVQASVPAILGAAIEQGLVRGSSGRLWLWVWMLLGVGAVQGVVGALRHRYAVTLRLASTYWTTELINGHAAWLGALLPQRSTRGEVVSIVAGDIAVVGSTFELVGQVTGSIVAFVGVAILLLNTSLLLGLVVLVGVPVLTAMLSLLTRPLQRRMTRARALQGALNSRAGDIVTGLRVLRGIGGEDFVRRSYIRDSQAVRAAGVRVASIQSVLNAVQVLLPGVFVVVVVWIGARLTLSGSLNAGQLVAFYGYASFLLLPLRTVTAFSSRFTQANVAADRIATFVRIRPNPHRNPHRLAFVAGRRLLDVVTAVSPEQGRFTVLACDDPAVGADIADRLGGYIYSGARYGPDRIDAIDRKQFLDGVMVNASTMALFTATLREHLDPHGRRTDDDLFAARHAASAQDILDVLPGGLAAPLGAGKTLSGGQRQRIVLARAVAADPDTLLLVEPTSAVDAHTEAAIATRLYKIRAGRTTVVVSTSPLLLDVADEVIFVSGGVVADTGTPRELYGTNASYRNMVERVAS